MIAGLSDHLVAQILSLDNFVLLSQPHPTIELGAGNYSGNIYQSIHLGSGLVLPSWVSWGNRTLDIAGADSSKSLTDKGFGFL
jgi:hypothetical protein